VYWGKPRIKERGSKEEGGIELAILVSILETKLLNSLVIGEGSVRTSPLV
jgi:hypothetical protein